MRTPRRSCWEMPRFSPADCSSFSKVPFTSTHYSCLFLPLIVTFVPAVASLGAMPVTTGGGPIPGGGEKGHENNWVKWVDDK